jgi:flagellar biosynthesis/type III secretory pathway chaperone
MAAVKEETFILNSLIEIGEEKKQLIIGNRLRELDTLVHSEGIVISRLESVEGARFKLQKELAAIWNLPVESLNSGELLSRVNQQRPALQAELEVLLGELKSAVSRLQIINQSNRDLTDYALEYVDYLWTVVEGDAVGLYSAEGIEIEDKSSRSGLKILDRKV